MNNENNKRIRFEICDDTLTALIIAIIGLTIVSVTGILSHYYTQRITAAFEAGYEEGTLQGYGGVHWVKTKSP